MGESDVPWVEGRTIGEALRETAARFGSHDALIFPQRNYQARYAEFDRQVDDAARGLLALGLQKGDHLAVWSTNRPEWVMLQFATARIGCVLVTINPAYRTGELEYTLRQSDATALALIERFKTCDYFSTLGKVCPELAEHAPGELGCERFPQLQWVISLSESKRPGMIGWQELLRRGRAVAPRALAQRESQLDPNDPINIQYTSGTTGFPKGAVLSHRNLLLNAYHAGGHQRLTCRDRICIPVPLYHCFGCVLGTLCAVVRGAATVFPWEQFRPSETLHAIEHFRSTAIYGVPTMFIALLEHESFPRRDLSSLRTGIMAGSPCPIELMERVTSEMGVREITIGYGQTEASPLITQTRTEDSPELRVRTVGRPIPGVEVRIVDPVTGVDVSDSKSGELWARGHGVMRGYYHMPEQTAQAIDGEGWLHTGDLAMRDESGYYRITGRLKDMIIRGGENVYPREIEELLFQHPKIETVQVVGVPDRKLGEEILAWIKLRSGVSATEDEIRQFCKSSLSHYKTPRYIKFVAGFPMTATGKIQKYKIRRQAIKDLGLEEVAKIETA